MTRSPDPVTAMAALALASPEAIIGRRELLVVAPHPDDESIGCGGLLAWAAAAGKKPRVLFVTDGEASHPGSRSYPPARLARLRQREALQACAALGLAESAATFLSAPDSGLASLSQSARVALVKAIAEWIKRSVQPVVCIPARSDPHSDHVTVHELVRLAVQHLDVSLYAYPVWTWTAGPDRAGEVMDGRRVDIAGFLDAKSAAIAAHASQHGQVVHDANRPFVLPEALLRYARLPYEVLFDVAL